LPFFLQIAVWISALAVCRNLKDIPAEPRQTASHLQEAVGIARKAFLQKPGLRYTILLAALLGLASFYPVWLIQPYMQSLNVPLAWFGPIWALANLCVSFGSIISHRIQYHLGARGTPILLLALIVAGYAGLAFNQMIWSFAFYFLLTIMRGIQGPFLRLALQKQSQRHERASILSLKSLTFRLGFVVTGPLVGMLADRSSLSFCFLIMMITQSLLIAIVIRPFLRSTEPIWNRPEGLHTRE
jgi:predicted MFS family arabinose efflux permease